MSNKDVRQNDNNYILYSNNKIAELIREIRKDL